MTLYTYQSREIESGECIKTSFFLWYNNYGSVHAFLSPFNRNCSSLSTTTTTTDWNFFRRGRNLEKQTPSNFLLLNHNGPFRRYLSRSSSFFLSSSFLESFFPFLSIDRKHKPVIRIEETTSRDLLKRTNEVKALLNDNFFFLSNKSKCKTLVAS